MLKLEINKTYLIQYRKLDGSIRPILCNIASMPLGSKHIFVVENDMSKTLLHSGVITFVKAKIKVVEDVKPVVCNNVTPEASKPTVRLLNGKYSISVDGEVIAIAHNMNQVERILQTRSAYKIK